MNFFVDCRMLYLSGIGRYIEFLLGELVSLGDNLKFVLAGPEEKTRRFLQDYLQVKKTTQAVPFSAPIYSLSEHFRKSLLLKRFILGGEERK